MTTTNNKPGHSFKKPCCSGTDDRAKPWTRLSETQFFKFPIDEYHTDGATTSEIVCDIDNAVHAMFTRDKFPYITTDCLLGYWSLAIRRQLSTRVSNAEAGLVSETGHVYVEPYERPLTARELAFVKLSLLHLATMVRFHRERSPECEEAQARQVDGDNYILPAVYGRWIPEIDTGKIPSIHYNEENYQTIVRLYHDANGDPGRFSPQLLDTYVRLANTLVHELAHAMHSSQHCDLAQIAIGDDSEVAEDGFNWENSAFGGVLSFDEGFWIVEKWPNRSLVMHYICVNGGMTINAIPDERICTIWRLASTQMRILLTEAFWDTVPAKGEHALKFTRMIGHRNEVIDCTCRTCTADAWDDKDAVLARDLFDEERPRSPSCMADECRFVFPEWEGNPNEYDGVPDEYTVLRDGTLILSELVDAQSVPAIRRKQENDGWTTVKPRQRPQHVPQIVDEDEEEYYTFEGDEKEAR